jgi:hypothetical protein
MAISLGISSIFRQTHIITTGLHPVVAAVLTPGSPLEGSSSSRRRLSGLENPPFNVTGRGAPNIDMLVGKKLDYLDLLLDIYTYIYIYLDGFISPIQC